MCGNALPSLSIIMLWSPGNLNCTWPTELNSSLIGGIPHATIINVNKINGDNALTI